MLTYRHVATENKPMILVINYCKETDERRPFEKDVKDWTRATTADVWKIHQQQNKKILTN